MDLNRTEQNNKDITTGIAETVITQCLILIQSRVDWGQSAPSSSAPYAVSFPDTCCSFPSPGTLFLLTQPVSQSYNQLQTFVEASKIHNYHLKVAECKCSLQMHHARQTVPIRGRESPRGLNSSHWGQDFGVLYFKEN